MMAAAHSLRVFSLREREGIAELALDVPGEKHNLLRAVVMEELDRVLSDVALRTDVRCLLVRSGKPGTFIAGADIKEINTLHDPRSAEEKSRMGQEVFNKLADLPFPTVAVIDGPAVGGGLELALACTYRLVSDNPKTQLGLPETGLGIVPGFGGTYRLPRAVGLVQALGMILSGKSVDGPKAARIGLALACYPAAFLDDKARAFAQKIASGGSAGPVRRRRRGALGRFLAEGNPFGRALVFRAARTEVNAKGGRHYPALQEVLSLLPKTARASRDRALELERRALGRTAPSRVCRNLIGFYFAREAARHAPTPVGQSTPLAVSRAAVLGAGVMGGKIAWLFAHRDIPAVMKDVSWDAVQKGFRSAYETFQELVGPGPRWTGAALAIGMHKLSGAVDYASLGKPDVVIEAVVEDLSVKKKVLAELEEHVAADALLASNTSSLSISEMAAGLARPERFVGHAFLQSAVHHAARGDHTRGKDKPRDRGQGGAAGAGARQDPDRRQGLPRVPRQQDPHAVPQRVRAHRGGGGGLQDGRQASGGVRHAHGPLCPP